MRGTASARRRRSCRVALARMGHRVEVLFAGPPRGQARSTRNGSGSTTTPACASAYVPHGRQKRGAGALRTQRATSRRLCAPIRPTSWSCRTSALRPTRLFGSAGSVSRSSDTSFVVFCHGTRQWITDVSGKVRVLPGAHAVTVLERASVELADAVVSPSAYLVDWMRGEGWHLPEQTFVIPHVSRAGATGEPPPAPAASARAGSSGWRSSAGSRSARACGRSSRR